MAGQKTAVVIAPCHLDHPDAQLMVAELGATLMSTTGHFTPWSYGAKDLGVPRGAFVVARTPDGTPVGCGAVRPFTESIAELKRMYARPGTRGVGAAILAYLEELACGWSYRAVWLETGRENLRAIVFYTRHGYQPIPLFGPYVGRENAVCFGKALTGAAAATPGPIPG